MRPRVFPAEDAPPTGPELRYRNGFNEAAGIPRGRRAERIRVSPPRACFNEAAGIPRGRHVIYVFVPAILIALQ